MRRIIALFLVLGISVAMLSGCGGDSNEKSESGSDNAEEESQYQIEWPGSGLAALLPAPKSNKLRNPLESSSSFEIEVEETSVEDYNDYVKACQDRGFTVDYYKMEDEYSAENEDGVKLDIFYYPNHEVMEIGLRAPKDDSDSSELETTDAESELEADTQDTQSEAADGSGEEEAAIETQPVEQEPAASDSSDESAEAVNPSVKEALDSYESFMDEYVVFMQKYKNSSDVTSMLSEYADYMTKYSDAIQKLNDMDTENFSAADWNYYIEVTSRVADKLADVA